jgi:hypothetical protein
MPLPAASLRLFDFAPQPRGVTLSPQIGRSDRKPEAIYRCRERRTIVDTMPARAAIGDKILGNVPSVPDFHKAAGFDYHFVGLDLGYDEYRSPGQSGTGADSGHFNLWQVTIITPFTGVPLRLGNMHFGEANPFTGGLLRHVGEWFQ